ncbi:MAG: polysaccharide biosynthesis protein, partial [Gammaproteobacteria bacterium]|nr:polysaccharide biosynthesis protein [Gammaproteobacteria bacterium]
SVSMIAWQMAWWIRFNLEFPFFNWQLSLYTLPIVLLVQGLAFWRFRLYKGLWRFASLPDLWNIFRAAIIGALSITLVLFISIRLEGIPRSILVLYPVLLIFLLGGPRLGYRFWKDHSFKLNSAAIGQKVLIVGAGSAGEMLVREMLREGSYKPIGFIDDNPNIKNSELHGIPIIGTVDDISAVHQRYDIDNIVIAVPTATNEQMQKIVSHCESTGVSIQTLPKLQEMISSQVALDKLREVSIEDLLGREKIELDWGIIQQGITNKIVLVSGGGGSIGSELCRQIARLNPAGLIIYEHSEFNLYNIQMEMIKAYPDVPLFAVLGNICDRDNVEQILKKHKPDILFHAAAYKHVPLLQNQLRIAAQNNIFGTKNLAELAIKYDCEKFVFISTDKAVNPANVLGASKRVAEMYCEWMNQRAATKFITVRFGNVLGSAGSVVPLFRKQIKSGGPVTVTDPEITRYFMTISEACQLILQSGAMGNGGEIFVLDMGKPVKISYLAEQMIKLSGRKPNEDIKIRYTGLRPGEKLYEELLIDGEGVRPTAHKKICVAGSVRVDSELLNKQLEELYKNVRNMDLDGVRQLLREIVPEYSPAKNVQRHQITSSQVIEN